MSADESASKDTTRLSKKPGGLAAPGAVRRIAFRQVTANSQLRKNNRIFFSFAARLQFLRHGRPQPADSTEIYASDPGGIASLDRARHFGLFLIEAVLKGCAVRHGELS
jgi:hypothetical protein